MTVDAPHPSARRPARLRRTRWLDRPPGRVRHRPGPRVFAVLAVLAVALTAGCGVRLETPPPTEPTPNAAERTREQAVADALKVKQVATAAASAASAATDTALADTLSQVADFADQHISALGGEYDSGLAGIVTPSTSSPMPPSSAAPEDVVVALVDAAKSAQSAVDTVDDGAMARLLASIAASETLSARRLATQIGSTAADTLTTGAVTVSEAPAGVGADDLATIITAEDSTGYALEVQAALAEGDQATALLASARTHRLLAQQWAQAAKVDATAQDPRKVAYTLPTGLDANGLVQQLDGNLEESYATLVGVSAKGSRATVAALLVQTATESSAWGEAPSPFPGLPERAG